MKKICAVVVAALLAAPGLKAQIFCWNLENFFDCKDDPVTADEALVSVIKQKCWAEGNVKLTQENITFSCDRAYLQWQTKTAEVTGSVKFENKILELDKTFDAPEIVIPEAEAA